MPNGAAQFQIKPHLTPLCPPGQAPPRLPARREGLMPRREALWAGGQRGELLPFLKGGKEGFGLWGLHNYKLTNFLQK